MANPLALLLVMPWYQYGKLPQQDLDLEILLGYLRKGGLSVQAVDAQRSSLDPNALVAFVLRARARIVYWNLRGRPDFRITEATIPLIKKSSPQTLMIAGGDFATRHDLALLDRIRDLDGVVRGEPELSLQAVAARVLEGEEWRGEPGISARTADGVIRNPARGLLESLDVLPAASDDLFEAGRLEVGQRVLFSRGCDSDCSYCGLQTPYRVEHVDRTRFWRCRSSISIVDEIEHYQRDKNVSRFIFNSFVLFGYGSQADQVEEVAREVLRRRLHITFSFVTHPGHLCRNRPILPLLKEAGLEKITLGMDTGLSRAFALYRLEFSRSDVLAALHLLHEHSVDFVPTFIFYDPFMTVEEILENLEFLEEIEPFFKHLEVPFGRILDQHLVNTTLRIRTETPVYPHLLEQGLADRADPLRRDPVVRFKSPVVGKINSAHRLFNRVAGQGIRPILGSPAAADRFPYLNRLPVDVLREIVSAAEGQPQSDDAAIASNVSEWAWGKLGPDLGEILRLL